MITVDAPIGASQILNLGGPNGWRGRLSNPRFLGRWAWPAHRFFFYQLQSIAYGTPFVGWLTWTLIEVRPSGCMAIGILT